MSNKCQENCCYFFLESLNTLILILGIVVIGLSITLFISCKFTIFILITFIIGAVIFFISILGFNLRRKDCLIMLYLILVLVIFVVFAFVTAFLLGFDEYKISEIIDKLFNNECNNVSRFIKNNRFLIGLISLGVCVVSLLVMIVSSCYRKKANKRASKEIREKMLEKDDGLKGVDYTGFFGHSFTSS